jgi:MFS family permease
MEHVSESSTSHCDSNSVRMPAGVFRTLVLIFVPFAAGYFLSYFFRTINALISDTLTTEFRLGACELGLLTSVYFLSAIVQLPLGVMVDRHGPRLVQSVLLLVAAAGAALFSAGSGLWTLVLGRALLGIGAGSIIACLGGASVLSYAIIAEYFPSVLIGQANAALSSCHIAGAFAVQYGFGFVLDRWAAVGGHYPPIAYRTAFVLVIMLQIAALAWFVLPDKATLFRIGASRRQGSGVGFFDALHESRRRQALRAIDDHRHLIGKAKADEVRRATEEFTRERVSIQSLRRIWQPQFLRVSLLVERARRKAARYSLRRANRMALEETLRRGRST